MMQAGTITRIEIQKKDKNRVAVFIEEAFAFGLDLNILAKFNLTKGDNLTSEKISEILLAEEKTKARNNAFRYLANRSHSEKELRLKLKNKGFAENLIDEVVEELKASKFLDDEEFALSFSRSKLSSKPMGERLLRQELWQKGINEKIIAATIRQVYSEHSQEDLAQGLVEKRQARYKNLEAIDKKKKLYDFLVRRGFTYDVINVVMK